MDRLENTNKDMIPPMEELQIQSVIAVKKNKTQRRKRCSRGRHRNPITKRCNIKCKEGYKRNKTSSRCKKLIK
jgi:hypothetical protein